MTTHEAPRSAPDPTATIASSGDGPPAVDPDPLPLATWCVRSDAVQGAP
jgi:hypothetical protein